MILKPSETDSEDRKKPYDWFATCAEELNADLRSHLHEIVNLKASAKSTADGVSHTQSNCITLRSRTDSLKISCL